MRSTNSPTPTGNEKQTTFVREVWDQIRNRLNFYDSPTVRVEQTTRGVRFHSRPGRRGGGGGSNWQSPREIDPTRAVPAGTKVFITPDNPLVTTGIVDLVSGTLTESEPGTWEAAVDVPAKASVGGTVKYNVPQFPYPGAGGYSAGPPVTGGLDAPAMFWIYWGALNC